MTTKKYISLTIATSIILCVGISDAGNWDCSDDGSAYGKSECYINEVLLMTETVPGGGAYRVIAGVSPEGNDTDHNCTRIYVDGTYNNILAVQSLMLTALTTGLPIRWYWESGTGFCKVSEIVVSKRDQ